MKATIDIHGKQARFSMFIIRLEILVTKKRFKSENNVTASLLKKYRTLENLTNIKGSLLRSFRMFKKEKKV